METMVEQLFAVGADQARSKFDAVCQVFFKKFEACTPSAEEEGTGGGRRNSEDEQKQGKASQQLVLPAPGGCKEGTPASCMGLELPRRGAHGECGDARNSGAENERKIPLSNSPSRPPMEEDALLGDF